jgi:hypothetical protein
MVKRRVIRAAALCCGILLSACAADRAYPLLTPIQVARDFGYFERPIDETHWVVSYVTPEQSGYGFRSDQSPGEAQAKALAFDLALWHASQVAQAHGYAGFSVTDRRFSTDAVNVTDYIDDPYWYGGVGFHRRRAFGGWGGAWGPGYVAPPQSSVQVEAKITIALTGTPNGEDFRSDETINRLRLVYPGADSAPVGGPAPPLPSSNKPGA